MSLENTIASAVKEAVSYTLSKPYPVFANKSEMAKMIGISTRQLDRLMMKQTLVEEVHYTRFDEGGHPMFAVKKVVAALKPELASLEELL